MAALPRWSHAGGGRPGAWDLSLCRAAHRESTQAARGRVPGHQRAEAAEGDPALLLRDGSGGASAGRLPGAARGANRLCG